MSTKGTDCTRITIQRKGYKISVKHMYDTFNRAG